MEFLKAEVKRRMIMMKRGGLGLEEVVKKDG